MRLTGSHICNPVVTNATDSAMNHRQAHPAVILPTSPIFGVRSAHPRVSVRKWHQSIERREGGASSVIAADVFLTVLQWTEVDC